MKKVLIVEDEHITREMLVQSGRLLFGDAEIHSTGTLLDALSVVESHGPIDTILLDLRIPGAIGMSGVEALREAQPNACIIVWTGVYVREDAQLAMNAGANGFLPKTRFHLSELAEVISEIECGKEINLSSNSAWQDAGIRRTYTGLSPKENEIHNLVQQGMTTREIAEKLGTSDRSIKQVRAAIRAKLGD